MDQRLRAALESAPIGILMTDADGRILLVNRELERMFGYSREDLLGRSVDMLVPMSARGRHGGYRAGFLGNPQIRKMGIGRDLFGVRKDGSEVPVEIGLTPVVTSEGQFVIGSVVDITARRQAESERKELEHQLQEAQRHEALGTLASGIAHDFNNLLSAITGYAELAASAITDEVPRRDLAKLLGVAARARGVIERILSFSRRADAERQVLDLGRTVAGSEELLRAALPANISLVVRRPSAPAWVTADETSMLQVVMNLATNAAHAMPDGGTIEIFVETLDVQDHMVRERPYLREGPYAVLRVRDTGAGIPDDLKARIFEPFFTTKPKGSGTGLGLAIVRNIVSTHHGGIELESEVGAGSEFRCFFPGVDGVLVDVGGAVVRKRVGSGQSVLYVDDEASVREVTTRQLQLLGYAAVEAATAAEALRMLEAEPRRFDLVITDYSMPGMNGLHLSSAVHSVNPDVPVVLFTGHLEQLAETDLSAAALRAVRHKPVNLVQLEDLLSEVLPAPSAARATSRHLPARDEVGP